MDVKSRLKQYIKHKGFKTNAFEKSIGASNGFVNSIRQSIAPDKLEHISKIYNDLNIEWLLTGQGEMIKMEGKGIHQNFGKSDDGTMIMEEDLTERYKSEGKLINKTYSKLVTILPAKAQLGLNGTMYKEDFIGKLPQKLIYTEDDWKGRYFDIECEGESMDSGDPRTAILEGDEIRIREIARDLYINNKLHFHEWDEFTFFHHERGILTKHVLDHDVEGRSVLLHSYNPDKVKFPDEWISLNDCYIVGNVISVTRPKGFKRKLNKLNKK